MTLTVFVTATKLWLTLLTILTLRILYRVQFENISHHCENGHIVESCEITAAFRPSAGCSSNAETYCWYIMLRSRYINIKGWTIQPKLDRTDPVKSAASESAVQYRSDTDSDL